MDKIEILNNTPTPEETPPQEQKQIRRQRLDVDEFLVELTAILRSMGVKITSPEGTHLRMEDSWEIYNTVIKVLLASVYTAGRPLTTTGTLSLETKNVSRSKEPFYTVKLTLSGVIEEFFRENPHLMTEPDGDITNWKDKMKRVLAAWGLKTAPPSEEVIIYSEEDAIII